MPKFSWEAKTKSGSLQKGVMEGQSIAQVEAQLKRYGLTGITVTAEGKKASFKIPDFGRGKVHTKDLVVFTRQFATMIDAGLPLVQCLDILAGQQDNNTFKQILYKVKESVESGSTFADALAKHPKAFDALYVNLVAAGEVGGILDTILNRLAAYIEKAMKLKKRVRGAMVYPAPIMAIAIIVVGVILIFVIPTFAKMFTEFGGDLPGPTKFVIALSNFFKHYIILIIILADTRHLGYVGLLYDFPNGDKVGHFVLFGLLSFVVNLSVFEARPAGDKKRLAVITSLLLALFIGIEEYSQRFFPARTADIFDFLASCAGVTFFAWLAYRLN